MFQLPKPDSCNKAANIVDNRLEGVHLHHVAISDRVGNAVLFSDRAGRTAVGMSLTDRLLDKGLDPIGSKVRTVTLSSFIERDVDLLKMDVEGVELNVLQELHRGDKLKFVKHMIVEFHRDRTNENNRLGTMLSLLEDAGFAVVIDSAFPPPYGQYRQQVSNTLMVYAYRDSPAANAIGSE